MTQITPRAIACGFIAHGTRREFLARGVLLGRLDRDAFSVFFARTDILLRESLWSFRSAESKYRIDRGGFVAFFGDTDILLRQKRVPLHKANEVPA